ncbi:Thiol-disulfide oxidoreductase ResA [Symmachiella dynata]|uniref:Thiol-disulfide oxidoreductase ResA n=1 Tax=Symmachiella dynata TaxID=2527995 RepID=A0A517ZKF5_9PLAN|nr:TlpA disulfide reductase family protein [Symmachiella dynata]QDU42937.1 Thiol-disulfide oxidoreductase ResA [Symmachiella dynata]
MAVFAIRRVLNQLPLCVAVLLLLGLMTVGSVQAEENVTLVEVLEKHRQATFIDVGKYVDEHPDADDLESAYFHLFREGLMHDMEVQAAPYAESYLKRKDQNPAMSNLAQRVRCMSFATEGDFEEAFAVFESLLSQARPQSADAMLSLGFVLASKARFANKVGISRDIYEQLSAKFPFNQKVTRMVQTGLIKHDLLDKPAPKIGVRDMEGKLVEWEQYKGKVVLVDFWATWCGPCIEEMPNLKKTYADLHDKGFEIIGINRDEDSEQVKAFLKTAGMKWPQILDKIDEFDLDKKFDAVMLPSTYLVDRNGILVQFDMRGAEIRTQVEQLLKKK